MENIPITQDIEYGNFNVSLEELEIHDAKECHHPDPEHEQVQQPTPKKKISMPTQEIVSMWDRPNKDDLIVSPIEWPWEF